jgi:hypothetical protein
MTLRPALLLFASALTVTGCAEIDTTSRAAQYEARTASILAMPEGQAFVAINDFRRDCRTRFQTDMKTYGSDAAKKEQRRCYAAQGAVLRQVESKVPQLPKKRYDAPPPLPPQTTTNVRRTQTCFATHPVTGVAVPYNC